MERLGSPGTYERAHEELEAAHNLGAILDRYRDKRVLVAGVPCSGKSTLLKHIPETLDMDVELFPKLSTGEKIFTFQSVFNLLEAFKLASVILFRFP